MSKNIVICCDGTNGQFGLRNTNVVRLFSVLEHDPGRQVAFYDPGLGTMGSPGAWTWWARTFTKAIGLAFAYGLKDRIGGAYEHLMACYEPGDKVFLFGFSRGAYTVRALAALLHMFGLIRRGNENLTPYLTDMFGRRNRTVFRLADGFKPAFSQECPIHFVGVWDTVSSVGWIYDPRALPFTAENASIAIGRHAVSIDERRCFFRQNLWTRVHPGQDLKQVWFAGVHSDVGGGYAASEQGLANISLEWMLHEARLAGLLVNEEKLTRDQADQANRPDPVGKKHESLTGLWWIAEWLPRLYWDMRVSPPVRKLRLPRGRPRFIGPGASIHSSVITRLEDPVARYHPRNIPAQFITEP